MAKNWVFGGAKGDRTPDLLHAMQALSQLSYGPILRLVSSATRSLSGVRGEFKGKTRLGIIFSRRLLRRRPDRQTRRYRLRHLHPEHHRRDQHHHLHHHPESDRPRLPEA